MGKKPFGKAELLAKAVDVLMRIYADAGGSPGTAVFPLALVDGLREEPELLFSEDDDKYTEQYFNGLFPALGYLWFGGLIEFTSFCVLLTRQGVEQANFLLEKSEADRLKVMADLVSEETH